MKLCIEGDIYFIPKFHILETGTVKLSIETGLSLLSGFLIYMDVLTYNNMRVGHRIIRLLLKY
jgi:hypothetical protein